MSIKETDKVKLEVGKRYLFNENPYRPNKYYEATVLEISPSGTKVKLKYIKGDTSWESLHSLCIVEELA